MLKYFAFDTLYVEFTVRLAAPLTFVDLSAGYVDSISSAAM